MIIVHRGKTINHGSWATNKIFVGVRGAAATILGASTATIDGITINEYGRVNPAGPDYAQPGFGTGTAQIQIGQPNGPGNPPELGNPGWSPYGLSDTTIPGGTSRAAR
jgi:hypothetical protein